MARFICYVTLFKKLKFINIQIHNSSQVTLVHQILINGQVAQPGKVTKQDSKAAGDEVMPRPVILVNNLILGEENETSLITTKGSADKTLYGTTHDSILHSIITQEIEESFPVQLINNRKSIIRKTLIAAFQTKPLQTRIKLDTSDHLTGNPSGPDFHLRVSGLKAQ